MKTTDGISAALEDYLESIYRIILKNSAVRVKDIAADLKVRKPSVTSALHALAKQGCVDYEPYGVIRLTKSGLAAALRITEKHRLLKNFLIRVLGVVPDTANEAACRMEHVIPKEVYSRLAQFIKFLYVSKNMGDGWEEDFRNFVEDETAEVPDKGTLDDYFDGTDFYNREDTYVFSES